MFLKKIFFLLSSILVSCNKTPVPKPAAYLSLNYNQPKYINFDIKTCPFFFDINEKTILKRKSNCSIEIFYPKMKATLYLNYKNVNGDLKFLLKDAQKLTYEHVIKADNILEQPYINQSKKKYGMFYQINGNAATNAQFYITDSTKNFIDCSLYFYKKPNFDSILPAVNYIKNDMRKLIESLYWK